MARSIREIYPKLREALQRFLQLWISPVGMQNFAEKLRKVTEMDLAEEDIVSMEDLAVACASSNLFRRENAHGFSAACLKQVAEDLLCLLQPVEEEELLPPEGPTDLRIWEVFAAAKMQQTQFCIAAAYAKRFVPKQTSHIGHIGLQNKKIETGLQRNNALVLAVERKFKGLVASFEGMHRSIHSDISTGLQDDLTKFTARLHSCCKGMIRRMTWSPSEQISHTDHTATQAEIREMKERWSRLSAEASQIAHQVAQLPLNAGSPDLNSLGSWSVVSEIPRDHGMGLELPENLEAGSMASGHSVGSQSSCLSGHGGPHCFLPSHLFKVLPAGGEAAALSLVWAKDLQNGAKILSADDASMEVIKVEKQKTNKLLELEIDDAVPFTTTPNHRIMVPSDDDETTVKAVDLKLGSWVLCSDRMAKKVVGKREYLVEDQDVFAITFHPDKAVACFLPPDKPLVLSKGLTRKPIRRSGMNRRVRRRTDGDEVASVPETAAGEYED